jgi:hypothetical protein
MKTKSQNFQRSKNAGSIACILLFTPPPPVFFIRNEDGESTLHSDEKQKSYLRHLLSLR